MIKFPFVVVMLFSNLFIATGYSMTTPEEVSSLEAPNVTTIEIPITAISVIPAKKQLNIPTNAKCPQWWQTAIDAGWAIKELPTLDMIMFRESRCLPKSQNVSDPNTVDGIKGSLGLTQLNAFWVQNTTYYPKGYLQTQGVVNNIRDLYDPYLNLLSALEVWQYGKDKHGCGWYAWETSCK